MRWAEGGVLAAVLLAGFAHADAPGYGKVETFQPGKKYNCVPTADHKGWDCSESGKNAVPKTQPAEATPAPTPAASAAETATKASDLPSYLTNAAASRPPRARQPAPTPAPSVAEPATPPQESTRATQASAPPATATESKPPAVETPSPAAAPSAMSAPPVAAEPKAPVAPEPAPNQTAAAPTSALQPTAAPQPVAEPPPAAAAIAPATADAGTVAGNREFLALPPASYILEIAHGANRDELAALRANLRLPFGELYELHLARDGNDWWLLVWGHFADIESARAARSDLPALPTVNAGWPRRSAPLQAEVRRTTE